MFRKFLFRIAIVIIFSFNCYEFHENHNQQQQVVYQHQNQNQQQNQHHNQHQNEHHNSNKDQIMGNINREHVMEHLDGVINKPKDQMSIDEQNFYYFKLHDYDNNNKLDGLELVSAFAHADGKLHN